MKNLPKGELDRVKDRYTEIVVQYEECTLLMILLVILLMLIM